MASAWHTRRIRGGRRGCADRSGERGVHGIATGSRDDARGLAEFAAGEEMDRYDGFWWGPDSRTLLVECFDSSPEPVWTISDPADPAARGIQHRYPRALTENAVVDLFAVRLGDDGTSVQKTAMIDWDNVAYEYLAVVDWQAERPVLRVLDRLQQHEQILRVAMPAENEWGDLRALDGNVMALLPVEVIAEHHNDQWIDLVGGTPCVTPSGAVVCSVNDMEADTNRLSVDGRVFTPAGVASPRSARRGYRRCVVRGAAHGRTRRRGAGAVGGFHCRTLP